MRLGKPQAIQTENLILQEPKPGLFLLNLCIK